jgi:hypothetical protein
MCRVKLDFLLVSGFRYFSLVSGGMTSVTSHLQAKQHKNALLAKFQAGCMANYSYFRELEPSKAEHDLAVYAYHTVFHNYNFRSMDCTTSLQKKLADNKFSYARTKFESIITNVYAPWSLEELKNDLLKIIC